MKKLKRNSRGSLQGVKESGRPLARVEKDKHPAAAIRRGLAQAKTGEGRPVDDAFDELDRQF